MAPRPEHWLPVSDFEGVYEVSDLGRVRGVDRVVAGARGPMQVQGQLLTPYTNKRRGNHQNVKLRRDGGRWAFYVHQLVLRAFVGPAPVGFEGCHKNGIATDNSLSNLYWGTSSQNKLDAVRHGVNPQAAKSVCPDEHKLSEPNLVACDARKGVRRCKACETARSKTRGKPGIDRKALANTLYLEIMAA